MATIKNIIQTIFSTSGAGSTVTDLNNLGRAQTRLGQSSASAGRAFSAQASGLGGLVAAYAGAAATTFALQQAYSKLAESARAVQTLDGLNTLAASAGSNSAKLLESVRELTNNQLTIVQAAQQTNLALSAGFSTKQIEGLSSVALKASRALGRDLTDAMTRVTRGSAKMETELLDELGIYTKIEPATRAYAAAIGKNVNKLSEFERRQAFVNSVIAEGEKKFKAINTAIPTSAERIEALGVKIVDLGTKFGSLIADIFAPLASFLTNNLVASFSLVGGTIALIASKGISVLTGAITGLSLKMIGVAASSENTARSLLGLKASVLAANNAIIAINANTLTLTSSQKAELVSLQQTAQQRALSTAEMKKAVAITKLSINALTAEITTKRQLITDNTREIASRKQTKDALWGQYNQQKGNIVLLNQARAATLALANAERIRNPIIAAATAQVNALNAALTAQQAITTKVAVATTGLAAALGALVASAIRGVSGITAILSVIALKFLGFATTVFLVITVLGLLFSGLTKLFGVERSFTAWVSKLTSALVAFFIDVEERANSKTLNNYITSTLSAVADADDKLRDLNSFTFEEKFLGVTIEVTKTREDLISEVQKAIGDVSSISFGEALSNTSITEAFSASNTVGQQLSSGLGAVLGGAIAGAIAIGLAPITSGLSTAFIGAATAAGATIGAAIGQAFSKTFASESEAIAQKLQNIDTAPYLNKYSSELRNLTTEQQNYALVVIDNLTKSYNGAELFNSEAKKALDLQVKTAIETLRVRDALQIISKVATAAGKSLEQVSKEFSISYDAATGIGRVVAELINTPTIIITIVSDDKTNETLDRIEQARNPVVSANLITSSTQTAEEAVDAATSGVNVAAARLEDILSGKSFATWFSTGQKEFTDFQALLISTGATYSELLGPQYQLTAAQRDAITTLQTYNIDLDLLRANIASSLPVTKEYAGALIQQNASLEDVTLRATSNFENLKNMLFSGTITQEEFAQGVAAVEAALSEGESTIIQYADTQDKLAVETNGVKLAVNSLTRTQQDNINSNIITIGILEEEVAIVKTLGQGYIDLATQAAFAVKFGKDAMSTLEFSTALQSAQTGTDVRSPVLEQLLLQTDATKAYAIELEALKSQLDSTNISDELKQEIQSTSAENVRGLEALANKSRELQVVNDRLQVSIAGVWVDAATLSRTALDQSEAYTKSLEAVTELGKQLILDSAKLVFSLEEENKQLQTKIANQRNSIALSAEENSIKAAQLEITKQINDLENKNKLNDRIIEVANSILGIRRMELETAIKITDTEIAAIESKAALAESVDNIALARLKAQRAEQQSIVDLQLKANEIRIATLQGQNDLGIIEYDIRSGNFDNISQVLSESSNRFREVADIQANTLAIQLDAYKNDYLLQLDILAREKSQADNKRNSEIEILEKQKLNIERQINFLKKEEENQVLLNGIRLESLNNEKELARIRTQGEIDNINSQAAFLLSKADIEKQLLADNIALEKDNATRAAQQLVDQYDVLIATADVYSAFISNYKSLLEEEARLKGRPTTSITLVTADQDFKDKRAELVTSITEIENSYATLTALGQEAIDIQLAASLNALSVELASLEARKKADEDYYTAKLILEQAANEASLNAVRAEISAREQEYSNLVNELLEKNNQITASTYESTQAQEAAYSEYISNVVSAYGNIVTAVNTVNSQAAALANSLSATIRGINVNNASVEARRVELGYTTQINDIQGDIAVRQSEINLLKAQEASSAGSGISAQERLLTLKKQEINFQAELNNLQAESTKRRLEAGIEAAQSSVSLFENNTSVSGLAGSIAALASVFAQQQELVELQRTQAEEEYRRELELIEIDRALLEEDKKAKGGAAAASAAILEAERELLVEQQRISNLELDRDIARQEAAIANIEAERLLLVDQAKLDGARARQEAAAQRAELEGITRQANVFSEFLNRLKTELPSIFNKILEAIGAVSISTDATTINIAEQAGLPQASEILDTIDSQITTLYGNLDGVSGRVFENINTNSTESTRAAEAELELLRNRKTQLETIQANELAAFDARARAQASGSAMELAEIDAREKELQLRIARATDQYAQDMQAASKAAADSVKEFVTSVVDTFGKFIVAQKQARINTLLAEEAQLKDVLTFQTESLTEAQTAASNALQEEISLREKLKDATESLTQSQTSYLESLGGEGSVKDASKQFIDTLLEQKQVIFDLQRATRSRISADSRSASLEQIQAQLTDSLTLKTSQRIEAEASLEKTQEKLALVTKLVSGEIGNFIKSLGSLGSSLSGISGGGSFGQVFSNLLGFQDALSSFATIGNTFAAAAGRQVAAANTQAQAAATINNAAATLTGTTPTTTGAAIASGTTAGVAGSTAATSGLTFSALASTAFAGAGVGSLIGALTGDTSWASTIGGAVGSTLATVFAGSTFVSAVSGGIATLATSAGFGAASSAIALAATPLVFAVIGALILGALFGKKKPKPQAVISGTVTGEGFETSSITSRDLSTSNIEALESIPEQVFAGFLSNFEAAGLQFQDRADVTIDFYKGEFRKIQTTFSSGLSTTASNIGKSAQDAAEELERQFFRGLGADSFTVDQFTPSRENIQQALRTFGELEDLDQKTRDRFVRGLEFAQEFDGIVRNLLGTSVKVVDIFRVIDSAARSLAENKLNEYNTLLATTADNLGRNSTQYATVSAAIRSNALSLLGLAENASGSLVSIRELSSELNAGAIAVRNIVAETIALRSTLSGLGSVLSGINIDQAISQSLKIRIEEFVNDFGNSLSLAVEILRDPARIVLVDLEKFIVNGTERIRQAVGVYDQLLAEQARGISIFSEIISKSGDNITKATELLGLELEGFISTISDKTQLRIIIDSAESIDDYAGAIARSAAQSRLAEINEIERTQATQQFNKVSREFTKRLREITGAASGLSIGGEGISFIDVLEAFGTTQIDQTAREFKSYLDLINAGSDISGNFNSAIDFLNTRFGNGESDSLKFVAALDLLQRVTLETVDSIGELVDAYDSTLQQITEAFNSSRQTLVDSISTLSTELVSLLTNVSNKTQEILGIFDDAVNSVTETGNAIFELRDAAKDAFTAASDAVSEFEKANKLSGKTAAELRAELESVNASIANVLGSVSFDIGSFIDLSSLTANQSSIQRELKRVSTTEIEYSKLLEARTTAAGDLAFVESNILELSDKLNDSRSTESKLVQDTRAAVLDFTAAQITLADVTDILTENSFNLNQARIDENSAVIKLSAAIRELNRDSITLDDIVSDILISADSTLRNSFIEGAITNLSGELATLDQTARAAKIAEVTTAAGLAFDSLIPLANSIVGLTNPQTVTNMQSVTDATNLTTDTFESLLNIFNANTLNPVASLISEINKFSAIGAEIANVSEFSARLLNLGIQTDNTALDVAMLVSNLNALETQLQSLTGDSGVESLREVFKGLAIDLQRSWDENVILGLPDIINLSAISVAPDGGLNELKTIATNSNKYAFIKAVGASGMEQAIFRAEGGYVSGPGTSTSDSIPAQLSNGEYVIKASTVRKLGLNILNDLNASGDLDDSVSYQGRFGDTIAAHINNAEADLLKQLGGSGTRNPVTGMLEFFGGASSGANAYGGIFAAEEAAYVKKIQDKFPSGNPKMQSSLKANYIDTRKLQDTYINTVGSPIDLLSKGGSDIMDTASYDSMQNQMLSSTMILDSLSEKRGLEGVTSQTQGFGTDSYRAPKKKKWYQKLLAAAVAFAVGVLTLGAGAPLALAALATAGTGLAINAATATKAGATQNKDLGLLFEGVTARDLGRGGYDIKNSPINKILANGSTIATGQSDLGTRQNTFLSKMLGGKSSIAQPSSIVDEYNKKNDKFYDFYMLNDPKIPNFVKPAYTAKNNSTGGIVKALNTSANLLGTNISGQRDSIPAMLEPGEFVLRKPAVDRMGLDSAIRLNSTGDVENDVNIEVNVINNSSPVTPTVQQTRRENGKIVIDVILEDVRNNGPIRQAIRGIK